MEQEERHSFIEKGQKYLQCKVCCTYQKVSDDSISITCGRCTITRTLKLWPMDEFFKSTKPKTGRPPGWHFMSEFVDKDGTVFHKGKEQPELKGTLKPTKVKLLKKRKKLTADEKLQRDLNKWKKRKQSRKKKK